MKTIIRILPLVIAGCGGAAPEKPQALPILQTTPAEACLATASAKREKRDNEPAKVTVKHVLIGYVGGKHAAASLKRSREEACLRAIQARDKLRAGADFSGIVAEYSDEPGAASRDGSVGTIERSQVEPAFADAAFELDTSQLSDVVETSFGFHLILRTQ